MRVELEVVARNEMLVEGVLSQYVDCSLMVWVVGGEKRVEES